MTLLAFILDVAIVVLGAVGTVLSWRSDGWGLFRYYTLDSNLLLLLISAVQAGYEARILLKKGLFVPSWVRVLKYAAVCVTTVTFFVVLLILVPMAGGLGALPTAFLSGSMLYHHLLCPVLGFVSLVFVDRPLLPDRRVTLWALAPTLLYAAVTIVLNYARLLHGPYPFLYVYEQPAYMSAVWCAAICGSAWVLAFLVWKLTLRFAAPRELAAAALPESAAWTADGYLRNQDALSAYTYRAIPASNNGCGPVAAFNLRRHAGHGVTFPEVLREMDDLHLLRVPGPTFLRVMRRYFTKHLPGWHETRGREAALAAAEKSAMGVFRYHEQSIPHFVAYYRADGGFRFFNVCDGKEDAVMTMAEFAAGHLLGGSVRLIWWE